MGNPSTTRTESARPAFRGRYAVGLAALLLGVAVVLASAVDPARGRDSNVFGNVGGGTPRPSCPTPDRSNFPSRKLCLTYASVTGFQAVANGKRGVFKARSDGAIVAWSLDLSRPTNDEKQTFNDLFEGSPQARISILKPQKKGRFKLTKQSPVIDLQNHYGSKPVITLEKPLRLQKGRIAALTTSSWLPNFAHDGGLGSRSDRWRGSRGRQRCGDDPDKTDDQNRDDLLASKPHTNRGSSRVYGCRYGNARVLYWAYFVADRGNRGGNNRNRGGGRNR